MTWKSRILLIFWALFALIMAWGNNRKGNFFISVTIACGIPAYNGSLIAYLTYPARSKAINTFQDILKEEEDVTIFVYRSNSQHKLLQETSDPVLQVDFDTIIKYRLKRMKTHILLAGCK